MDVEAEVDRLAERVGRERFESACEWALRTSDRYNHDEWPGDLDEVPHELADLYDESDLPLVDQVRLGFALFRRMPCYGHLMYLDWVVGGLEGDDRTWFWGEMRALLEDADQRMSTWIEYWLWVDWFETKDEEAWREVTRFEGDWRRRIARVLSASGPVPWSWKRGLYRRFVHEGPEWQQPVFEGLRGSAFDLYGEIDRGEARELLAQLSVPEGTEGLKELREKLARDDP